MPAGTAAQLWSLSRNNNSNGSNSWRAVHEQKWHGQHLMSPYSVSPHENPMSILYTINKHTPVCQGAKPVLLIGTEYNLTSQQKHSWSVSDGDLTLRDKTCRSHRCPSLKGSKF